MSFFFSEDKSDFRKIRADKKQVFSKKQIEFKKKTIRNTKHHEKLQNTFRWGEVENINVLEKKLTCKLRNKTVSEEDGVRSEKE